MPFRASLQAIVDDLRAPGPLAPSFVAGVLRRHPVVLDDVAPWVRFDAADYARNLITRDDRWELRVLCWRPNQSSSLHIHGGSACAFRIVRGSATEFVLGQRDRTWTPGDVVEECSPLVHQVSNASADPLISLHAYGPALPVDYESPADGRTVVIVGGGFSGVAAAYHLLEQGSADLRVVIVERGPWLGRGIAYGCESACLKLNVPASKMSIDPKLPNDFVEWAGIQDTPQLFLARPQYATYVEHALTRALGKASAKLRVIRGEVARVEDAHVQLVDGRSLRADAVVLASGLQPGWGWLRGPADSRIIEAWDECELATLPSSGRILLVGAGLTAVDVVGVLHGRGFLGQIHVVSRHGLLPRPHVDPEAMVGPGVAMPLDWPTDLRGWVRWVRDRAEEAEREGRPWQSAVDSLRPHFARIWGALSPNDRRRFVRHVRPHWDVVRHRAPMESMALVRDWQDKGNLILQAGRVQSWVASPEGIVVRIHGRDGRTTEERFDAVVRCLGPAVEHAENPSPLVLSLIEAGWATPDPAGLGIVTDVAGRVVPRAGIRPRGLFALGVHRRASSWETIAVPEIARHAAEMARELT